MLVYRLLAWLISRAVSVAVLVAVLGSVQNIWAADTDICLPNVGGLGGIPTIDGIVEGYGGPGALQHDVGWNGATTVNLSADNGVTRASRMLAGTDGTFVYLSLVVDMPMAGADNTIVLGLSTDGNSANDWRIHLMPLTGAIAGGGFSGSNVVPAAVIYWRNSDTTTGWNTSSAMPNPVGPGHWLHDNARISKHGSRWTLELKIPRETDPANASSSSKIYFPSEGTFQMYVNVISASFFDDITRMYTEDPWPLGSTMRVPPPPAVAFLTQVTPEKSAWGTASLVSRPECTGVSIAYNNIGVKIGGVVTNRIERYDPPGSATFTETQVQCEALSPNFEWPAKKGPLNMFVARPLNGTGSPVDVSASFKIANWGLPSPNSWVPLGEVSGTALGVMNNPTVETSISPGLSGELTATWELSYRWSCLYAKRSVYPDHDCIHVDLDSSGPTTRFLNKSAERNMQFVSASRFSRNAEISTYGYGAPAQGRTAHEIIVFTDTSSQTYVRDGKFYYVRNSAASRYPELSKLSADLYPDGLTEVMTWIARGYLKSGKALIINGNKYEYAKAIGAFGYVVGHPTQAVTWTQGLTGQNIQKVGEGAFLAKVQPESAIQITTTVEAHDQTTPPPSCGCFNLGCWIKRMWP